MSGKSSVYGNMRKTNFSMASEDDGALRYIPSEELNASENP